MKSICVSTSQRTVPLIASRSRHELEPRARLESATDLRRRTPVGEDDVRGEVIRAADERRADAVRVHRHALLFEVADLLDRETARGDDLHPLEPVPVERVAHLS